MKNFLAIPLDGSNNGVNEPRLAAVENGGLPGFQDNGTFGGAGENGRGKKNQKKKSQGQPSAFHGAKAFCSGMLHDPFLNLLPQQCNLSIPIGRARGTSESNLIVAQKIGGLGDGRKNRLTRQELGDR
jgi:hypothetical protein